MIRTIIPASIPAKPRRIAALRGTALLSVLMLSAGCQSFGQDTAPSSEITVSGEAAQPLPAVRSTSIPLADRIAWPEIGLIMPASAREPLYTFAVEDLPLSRALELFAEAYSLNMVVDQEVDGTVSVDFHDLPLTRPCRHCWRAEATISAARMS